jgi:hypothetical protein
MDEEETTINVIHVPVAHLVRIEVMGEPEVKEENECCNKTKLCMEITGGAIMFLVIVGCFAYLILWL